MQQAGISRKTTVIWNIVPWWNGTRKITTDEIRDGATAFESLRQHLSKLCAVVMVGKKAAGLRPSLATTGMELFQSYHPSPLVRARFRSKWEAIPSEWAEVMDFIRARSYVNGGSMEE